MKLIITQDTPIPAGFKGEVVIIDHATFVLLCLNSAMFKCAMGMQEQAVYLLHMAIYRFRTRLTRLEQEFLAPRRFESIQYIQGSEDETG